MNANPELLLIAAAAAGWEEKVQPAAKLAALGLKRHTRRRDDDITNLPSSQLQ
jgi:hypothetical protein